MENCNSSFKESIRQITVIHSIYFEVKVEVALAIYKCNQGPFIIIIVVVAAIIVIIVVAIVIIVLQNINKIITFTIIIFSRHF